MSRLRGLLHVGASPDCHSCRARLRQTPAKPVGRASCLPGVDGQRPQPRRTLLTSPARSSIHGRARMTAPPPCDCTHWADRLKAARCRRAAVDSESARRACDCVIHHYRLLGLDCAVRNHCLENPIAGVPRLSSTPATKVAAKARHLDQRAQARRRKATGETRRLRPMCRLRRLRANLAVHEWVQFRLRTSGPECPLSREIVAEQEPPSRVGLLEQAHSVCFCLIL